MPKFYGAKIEKTEGSGADCKGKSARCLLITFYNLKGTVCNECPNRNISCTGVTKDKASVTLVPTMGDPNKGVREFIDASNCKPSLVD